MAILIPKPWVNLFEKMSIFLLFQLLVFLSQKDLYLFQNIVKETFFWPILPPKKRFEKWPFGDQNHGLTPLEKCQFFDVLTSCFHILERPLFVLEYRKRHFSGLFCLKKKVRKMAIFIPKPWVNPFGKMSIFRLFQLFVFIFQKGLYSFQNIVKDIFLAYFA